MSVALRVYEQLTDAGEDKVRAKAIADGFEQLEERFGPLRDAVSQGQVRESELRLTKEIEGVRLEIKEVEANLRKEIEGVRLEIEGVRLEVKEVEAKLRKEIEGVRLEIEGVRLEVKELEVKGEKNRADLVRWVVAVGFLQSSLIIGVLLKISRLI